jgi:hypothetical protein
MKLDFSLLDKSERFSSVPNVPHVQGAAIPEHAKECEKSETGHPAYLMKVPRAPIFSQQAGTKPNDAALGRGGHSGDVSHVPPGKTRKPNTNKDSEGLGHVGQVGREQSIEPQHVRYPLSEAGAPYMPYVVPMAPERVEGLLANLRETIGKVADIEGWTVKRRADVLGLVARQPVASLTDDLAYFQEHLSAIEAVARVAAIDPIALPLRDASTFSGWRRR